ncbi:MAG: histone deacetylase [Euryarchaeota archaeon]|nr:histone deacetylase [Euryarchaeota archaeon]
MDTGFVYHEDYLKHDTGAHPESAERLIRIMSELKEAGVTEKMKKVLPVKASKEQIAYVHTDAYIKGVERMCKEGGGLLDPDTPLCTESYEIALLSAGGVIKATDEVMNDTNNLKHIFALVRPPGHHATGNRGRGFCIFNNIAIAAEHLKRRYYANRILIVDWDVHHGNGTQEVFFDDPSVLYFSIHQYPHYPGTGWIDEVGKGKGDGFSVNAPLPAGSDDAGYLYALNNVLVPIAKAFEPEFVLVSAGFDAHVADPLASMNVTTRGFGLFMDLIKEIAEKNCNGKIVIALEGGYNLDAIAKSAVSVFNSLLSRRERRRVDMVSSGVVERVEEIKGVQRRYWSI